MIKPSCPFSWMAHAYISGTPPGFQLRTYSSNSGRDCVQQARLMRTARRVLAQFVCWWPERRKNSIRERPHTHVCTVHGASDGKDEGTCAYAIAKQPALQLTRADALNMEKNGSARAYCHTCMAALVA